MRFSQFFIRTQREVGREEESANAQLLTRAGFIDRTMAGVYTFLPLGWRVEQNLERIIRQEIEAVDGTELYMPALQPKELLQQTGRWDEIDVLYTLKTARDQEVALGATHEEVLASLLATRVSSYRDLPLYLYQIQSKFRDEKRAKSGLLRGREFIMKDLYSFHADRADLEEYYDSVKEQYRHIFRRCGLDRHTYVTYASGGTFAKYSHEFQAVTEAGEDTVYICDTCNLGVNAEIIEESNSTCPDCGNDDLRESSAIEVGNIFKLGTKFSEPFDLTYTDTGGETQPVVMGSYGIGVPRLLGAIVEIWHDDNGIIWPEEVAPFTAHLIAAGDSEAAQTEASQLHDELEQAGVSVLYDDRTDTGTGERFTDADLIGCPYRLVVSDKTLKENSVEIKRRDSDEPRLVPRTDVVSELSG